MTVYPKAGKATICCFHTSVLLYKFNQYKIDILLAVRRAYRKEIRDAPQSLFMPKLPFSTTITYSSRLQALSLLPLCYWHEYLDMVFFFKLTHGQVNQSPSVIPPIRSIITTKSSSKFTPKFTVPKCKITTGQRSFLIRSTRIWNTLADPLHLTMDTLSSFQSVLLNYYYTDLENTSNIDDPRTFKTICIRCNQVRNLNSPITCCY